MARPRKRIDGEQVRKLAGIGCSTVDIGYVVGCSVDTLDRRFADEIAKGRAEGRTTLRRRQWDAAMQGNVVMLIFLGKNLLAQSDRAELTGAGAPLVAVNVADIGQREREDREWILNELRQMDARVRAAKVEGILPGPDGVPQSGGNGDSSHGDDGGNGHSAPAPQRLRLF